MFFIVLWISSSLGLFFGLVLLLFISYLSLVNTKNEREGGRERETLKVLRKLVREENKAKFWLISGWLNRASASEASMA